MRYTIKLLSVLLIFQLFASCSEYKNRELYELTDKYVRKLDIEYEHYGAFGGPTDYTKDGEYKVQPFGRLINVRIEGVASDEEYEDLIKDLEKHYKGDMRVNNVYRCQAGTIMIDCRN